MTFVTLPIWPLKNVELIKDVGMIPYTMFKHYNMDAKIIVFIDNNKSIDYILANELVYFKKEVKGLEPIFVKVKKINSKLNLLLKSVVYIIKNAKTIDILNFYHLKRTAFICAVFYKLFNPKGIIYMKLDTDGLFEKKYFTIFKRLMYLGKRLNIIYSVETYHAKRRMENFNIGLNDLIYIPNGAYLNKRDALPIKDKTILTVARLGTWHKATDVLLEAFNLCSDKIPGWTLKLIGPIDNEFKPFIREYFKRHPNLKTKIIFTGNIVDRDSLNNEYKNAKIFILPSRKESFGIVIVEAIVNGCYIVGSDAVPTCYDIKKNGGYISTFPADDSKALANILIDVCNNVTFTNELYERILDYAEKYCLWENILSQLYDKITTLNCESLKTI